MAHPWVLIAFRAGPCFVHFRSEPPDRHEDITHPSKIEEDEECARSLAFYGYVRGTNLKGGTKVHLIGVGDYDISEIAALPDPCPVFDKEKESQVNVPSCWDCALLSITRLFIALVVLGNDSA